jgi:hypothetical protein
MLEDSYNASYVPEPKHVQRFFEYSNTLAQKSSTEIDWYKKITEKALNWLTG